MPLRIRIDKMSSGLNGPSANVPSMSNDTVPTPSLQRLVDDTVHLIAERYAISPRRSFNQSYYNELLEDPYLREAVERKMLDLVDEGGVVSAAEWIECIKLRVVFG